MSDLSPVFEMDDIFTRKDAISGLKSSPWAGFGKLVNVALSLLGEFLSNFKKFLSIGPILIMRCSLYFLC